jgi:hypothetical protein
MADLVGHLFNGLGDLRELYLLLPAKFAQLPHLL